VERKSNRTQIVADTMDEGLTDFTDFTGFTTLSGFTALP
jgi:hypothetical protein